MDTSMKYLIRAAIACAALVASGAYAQTYNYFKPGCALSGTGSSQTVNLGTGSGCVAGNLPPTNLNSGSSASSTTFWRGDGTWATPSGTGGGTVNSVALSAPSVFSVAGSPVTNTGTLALTFASGQTANEFLASPDGSTGAVTLRSLVVADLFGGTGASSSTFLRGDGTWVAPSGVSAANPSASAGLTAVNGSATTYLRSDGAPAISQAIVPTWSGVHTFGAGLVTSNVGYGASFVASSTSATPGFRMANSSAAREFEGLYISTGAGTVYGAAAGTSVLNAQGGMTLSVNDLAAFNIGSGGNLTTSAPASGTGLTINGVASGYALNVTGAASAPYSGGGALISAPATASSSNGLRIIAGTNSTDFQLTLTDAANTVNHWIFDGTGSLASSGQTQQGAGTINVAGLYVNGTAVGAGSSPANPATSIGLTVANGSATTFMRSDAAPALAQNISPTWTGTHTFSNGVQAASLVLGSPTGGNKGAGTVNATAVYANGVSLSGVSGLVIAKGEIQYGSGSICTVASGYNIASCTKLGTGEYEVIFTSSIFSTVPVCTVTAPSGDNPGGNNAAVSARFVSTPNTADVVIGTNSSVSPFTSTDQYTNIICVGS